MKREEKYSVLLIGKIEELFQRENEDGEEKESEEFIDLNDFREDGAYNDFLLSLCSIVPGFLTKKILKKDVGALELNHHCNSILIESNLKSLEEKLRKEFEEGKKSLTK